uniref:NPH3 domain-containing protein n=1 Tax=Araucaria cunninghamii TaxID=56994 RepID=A0A0D6QVZ0_ARACU
MAYELEDGNVGRRSERKAKKQLLTKAMKRSEWIFSHDIPSDVAVHAGEAKFSVHKFPLASKCGYIRKLVAQAQDADVSMIYLSDIPGGAEAFELVAKFCYGINFEVSTTNIAMLRCAAEYLQMTEEYACANLVSRTETYINEVVLKNLSSAVIVLHSCENLLPMAEDLQIVSRSIDVVASRAYEESQFGSPDTTKAQNANPMELQIKPMIDWWVEELVVLRIDFFQRAVIAMKSRGFKHGSIGAALMFYAQKSLRGLDIFGTLIKKSNHEEEHEQRILIETIVSLLPTEKNSISVSFLCWLLRAAIYLETTVACKLELEHRIGLQLEQATLDDLLIPSFSYSGDTIFDVDAVHRIAVNFLEEEKHCDLETHFRCKPDDSNFSPALTDLTKVAKLLENYLAEIAPDANMSIAKFTGLAELLPKEVRLVDDGIYRAIDIYLKAHPSLNELERKKVCSVMDCQKLSREACAHAAQNERLPVQIVVQVLYFEQQRLRNTMSGTFMEGEVGHNSQRMNDTAASVANSPYNEFVVLRKENQDLKLEIARLRKRLNDLEKDRTSTKQGMGKPPLHNKTFLNSVSRKLGKLNPFMKLPDSTTEAKPGKIRRHSVS